MTGEQRKTTLVTGAGGFIGGFLCQRLIDEGFYVRALALPEEGADHLERMGCSVVRGDLTKPHTIRGICEDVDPFSPLCVGVAVKLAGGPPTWATNRSIDHASVVGGQPV